LLDRERDWESWGGERERKEWLIARE